MCWREEVAKRHHDRALPENKRVVEAGRMAMGGSEERKRRMRRREEKETKVGVAVVVSGHSEKLRGGAMMP